MTVYVNTDGRIVGRIQGTTEIIELNTPEGCIAVDDPPSDHYYYAHPNWVPMPPRPDGVNEFDYTTKQWVDPRSLDEIKAQKWGEIKTMRDELEFGGFEFEGHRYDSDAKAQGRITAAAQLGIPVEWTLQDNSTIWLESADLQRLVVALATHVTTIHARGKIAREKIYNATTIAEVEAVEF